MEGFLFDLSLRLRGIKWLSGGIKLLGNGYWIVSNALHV